MDRYITTSKGCAFPALFFLLLAQNVHPLVISDGNERDVCDTEQCKVQADKIKNMMNTKADPCNNFFEYACGGWVAKNPVPKGYDSFSQFSLVQKRTDTILKELLEAPITENDRDAFKKLKKYFKACLNEEHLEKADMAGPWSWIEKLGGMILFGDGDDEDFVLESFLANSKIRYVDFWGVVSSPIVDLGVHVDQKDIDRHVITINQPGLIMSSALHYVSRDFAASREKYKYLVKELLTFIWKYRDEMKEDDTFEGIHVDDMVNMVFNLEKDLSQILQPPSERYRLEDLYTPMNLSDTATMLSSDFDWFKYVQEVFNKAHITVTDSTPVVSFGTKYLSSMMAVLSRYPNSVIQTYVVIYNVMSNLELLSKEYRNLASAYPLPRVDVCTSKASAIMPRPMGALYAEKMFSGESKREIIEMQRRVTAEVITSVTAATWADDATKKYITDILSNMTAQVGYPDEIVDKINPRLDEELVGVEIEEDSYFKAQFDLYEIELLHMLRKIERTTNPDEWVMGAADVDAYYNNLRGTMVFPAAVLQPPFYDANRPTSMTFGAVGAIVGWMLTSTITDSGTKGWTSHSREKFKNIESCFANLYSSFYYEIAEMFLNGNSTLVGNMNDNGGLRHAYSAYTKWAEENEDEFFLPGLENITPEKLFFLSYAQMWCETETIHSAKSSIATGYTTPGLFRTEGAIRNLDNFGRIFECEQGLDKLFPSEDEVCIVA